MSDELPPTARMLQIITGYWTSQAVGTAARLGVDAGLLAHLAGRYGGESRIIVAMLEADPELAKPLVPGLPYLRAEAVYAARYEMAQTVDDVLVRRTRALLLDNPATAASALDVARLLAPELGWTPERVDHEVASLTTAAAKQRDAAGLAHEVA